MLRKFVFLTSHVKLFLFAFIAPLCNIKLFIQQGSIKNVYIRALITFYLVWYQKYTEHLVNILMSGFRSEFIQSCFFSTPGGHIQGALSSETRGEPSHTLYYLLAYKVGADLTRIRTRDPCTLAWHATNVPSCVPLGSGFWKSASGRDELRSDSSMDCYFLGSGWTRDFEKSASGWASGRAQPEPIPSRWYELRTQCQGEKARFQVG